MEEMRCTRLLKTRSIAAILALFLGGFFSSLRGAVKYATPADNLNTAIMSLSPGDTLVLKDGTYTRQANGNGTDIISLSNKSGTASAPITIKAENERRAFLKQDGTGHCIFTNGCSYLVFDGIRTETGDLNVNLSARNVRAYLGSNITFRRLLVNRSNRYRNEAGIQFDTSHYGLAEENEVYSVRRNVIFSSSANNCVFRRNYINSRGVQDISGGFIGAGDGIGAYPGSGSLFENNISERSTGYGFVALAPGPTVGNRFLGNIALNNPGGGFLTQARGSGADQTPTNTEFTNNLAYKNNSVGFYIRSALNTRGGQNSSIRNLNHGYLWDRAQAQPGSSSSFFMNSLLSIGNSASGFMVVTSQIVDWLLDYADSYNNSGGSYNPATSPKLLHAISIDPQLGNALVFIPVGSPMKGAGKGGADIGANIIYRYQNGQLTNVPLWNSNGSFPHGAIVPGVNDIPGSSAYDVHTRLGTIPVMGVGAPPPPPPTGVDVSQNPPVSQPPVYQQQPPTSQPSGPSTSQVAIPFLIAGVIGAALLLGSD